MLFHEAPHKLKNTLDDLCATFGAERRIALCRELTKAHEEILRLTIGEAIAYHEENTPRGEYVLVVGGRTQEKTEMTLEEGVALVLQRKNGGMKLKDAVRSVADDTGLPRNALYDAALKQ